jgi:crossover junction endodeoxyribonuclease RuvC
MIILGIDPGTATTGYGIIKKQGGNFEILDYGVITTDKTNSGAERLLILMNDLGALIKKFKPTVAGVEKLFFTSNAKTAMQVSQARGVILGTLAKEHVSIQEFTPLQVKSTICGYGKAEKRQIQFMIKQTFKLKTIPKPDDAADALAIALCAALKHAT